VKVFIIIPAVCVSLNILCCSENRSPSQDRTSGIDSSRSITYEERQGKQLYIKYCSVCHGQEGEGDGFNAFNLDPKPRDFTDSTYMNSLSGERLIETITEGGRGVNRSPLMPSWNGRLSGMEIEYIVSYIRRFSDSE